MLSGRVTQYALAAEGGKWYKWLNQNGGAVLDDYRNPSKCMLSTPESIAAVVAFRRSDGARVRHAPLPTSTRPVATRASSRAVRRP